MKKFLKLIGWEQKQPESKNFTGNCTINERTGDGKLVGRCWYATYDNICPRHGDVSCELAVFRQTNSLSPEIPKQKN